MHTAVNFNMFFSLSMTLILAQNLSWNSIRPLIGPACFQNKRFCFSQRIICKLLREISMGWAHWAPLRRMNLTWMRIVVHKNYISLSVKYPNMYIVIAGIEHRKAWEIWVQKQYVTQIKSVRSSFLLAHHSLLFNFVYWLAPNQNHFPHIQTL